MAEIGAYNPERPVAVVTGASSGFGESIVRELADWGWLTIGVARREDRLAALADEVDGEYVACDITKPEAAGNMAAAILDRHPSIDVLVNSAGMAMRKRLVEASPGQVTSVMDTNYIGSVRVVRTLLPGLKAAGRADIIDIVSAAATITNPHSGPYSVSKSAQLDASRAFREDLRSDGIAVHTILPGKAHTEGHPQAPSSSPISKLTRTDVGKVTEAVMGRIGQRPKEVHVPGILKGVAVAYGLAPVTTGRVVSKLIS